MATLSHTNLPVHLLKDAEKGIFTFMVEVEGALIPFGQQKIGHVEAWIRNKDQMSVRVPAPVTPVPAADPPVTPATA